MRWPTAREFNEAVQNLSSSVSDDELRSGAVAENEQGLPLLYSGNFADVYRIHCESTGNTWAVKCFTKGATGLRERYHEISLFLAEQRLPFMVDFRYLDEGIRIGSIWYPVVKMRWIEGQGLNDFVARKLDKPAVLDQLFGHWVKLAVRLREAGVTHGDLQHGNVLLVPKDDQGRLALRLIDYDGMSVPALATRPSGEVGHRNYQHPLRAVDNAYGPEVDRFSHLAICCAVRCLREGGRALWSEFSDADNLLFREQDFLRPDESPLFRRLWKLRDASAHSLVGHLVLATQRPLKRTPQLDELMRDGEVRPLRDEERHEVQALLQGDRIRVVMPRPALERLHRQLETWLGTPNPPADFYELLGYQCFYPDSEEIQNAALAARRFLSGFRAEPDQQVRSKALHLQELTSEASRVFSDQSNRASYDAGLSQHIVRHYANVADNDPSGWRHSAVMRWLKNERRVHASSIEPLLELVRSFKHSQSRSSATEGGTTFRSTAFPWVEKGTFRAMPREFEPDVRRSTDLDTEKTAYPGGADSKSHDDSSTTARGGSVPAVDPFIDRDPTDRRHEVMNTPSACARDQSLWSHDSLLWMIGSAIVSTLLFVTIFSILLLET